MGQVLLGQSLSPAEITSLVLQRLCLLSGVLSSCFPACFCFQSCSFIACVIFNDFIPRRSDFLFPPEASAAAHGGEFVTVAVVTAVRCCVT